MSKIVAFFKNKAVRIIAWILLAASVVALGFGGAMKESVSGFDVVVFSVVAGVSALIAFITNAVKSDK
ncbi:hypothetical protein [Treponema sp. SP13]|uniref:hypothetical protein n=1 Tax=Treponema sp. SP13 TaxID=2789742 RepID=UPI003D8E1BEB